MEDDLVTIRNYAFGPDPAGEAELARIKLESAGILCFLAGREFASMYWLGSGANSGVKLQVKRSDAQRALEMLGPEPAAADQEVEREARADESVTPPCPRCHSAEVVYERFSRRFFYLSLLVLGFPLLWGRGRYRCGRCGYPGDGRLLPLTGPIGMRIGPREPEAAGRNDTRAFAAGEKKAPAEPQRGHSRKPM